VNLTLSNLGGQAVSVPTGRRLVVSVTNSQFNLTIPQVQATDGTSQMAAQDVLCVLGKASSSGHTVTMTYVGWHPGSVVISSITEARGGMLALGYGVIVTVRPR